MDDNFFIHGPIRKLKTPEYSPLETIQLLFQAFFNITNNKRDIQKKKKILERWKNFCPKIPLCIRRTWYDRRSIEELFQEMTSNSRNAWNSWNWRQLLRILKALGLDVKFSEISKCSNWWIFCLEFDFVLGLHNVIGGLSRSFSRNFRFS